MISSTGDSVARAEQAFEASGRRQEGRKRGSRAPAGRFSKQGGAVDGTQRAEGKIISSVGSVENSDSFRGSEQPCQQSSTGTIPLSQQIEQSKVQHPQGERIQNAPTRSRQRRKTKKTQDLRTECHNHKPQLVSSVSEEALVRMKAEAEAEDALAAARAVAEEKERLVKFWRDKEKGEIQELRSCVETLQVFHESFSNRRKNREFFSPANLVELRARHNSMRKTLKSDLKRCTAFVKKVKTATSFHCNDALPLSSHPLIKDVETLNLSRYVEEIASSLFEAKLKVTDVPLVIALCSAIHERYEEYIPTLTPKLLCFVQTTANISNTSSEGNEDQGGGLAFKQRRVYLRLLTELVLNGMITDTKPLTKIISDAVGAPKARSNGANQSLYQITDAALLTSFVKLAGVELLGVVPRTVRVAFRDAKKVLMQSQLDVGVDTAECEENRQITSTNAIFLDDPLLIDLRSEKCQLLDRADELIKALQPTVEAPDAVVLDTSCKILNNHCIGAYRALSSSYLSTAAKLRKLEKRCEQDRLLTGSLSEAREKGLLDAQKLSEQLKKSIEAIAEALDQDLVTIQDEEEDDPAVSSGGTGVQLWTKAEEFVEGTNLGPFDDEETRAFYCDLPDLLSTKPPALLGLTPEQVELKMLSNSRKYGSFSGSSEELAEYPISTPESSFEPVMENFSKDDTGEDARESSGGNRDLSLDRETPHYKLKVLLDEEMCECNRREATDELAERFCVNHGSSKSSRKRLVSTLFSVPQTRLDLLPQYARFAAIVDRVYDDVAVPLVANLEAQFHGQAKWRKTQNIDGRLRTSRFIGELTKFRVAPPIVPLKCLKRCLEDFSGSNIDVACCLLETCGRFLYRTAHTQDLLSKLLDTMMRLRKAKMLDERCVALLESAFFIVNPPQRNVRKHTKVYSPLEAYIRHLLLVKLTPNDVSQAFATKQILRLPWNVPEMQCGALVSKYMLKACLSGRCGIISAILAVATTLKKIRREVVVKLVDLVLEELKWSMENPTFRCQQRAIGLARILGQLYLHSLISSSLVFYQLSEFLNLGHEIPSALLEACERNARYEKSIGDAGVFDPVVKFASAPLITNSIPEDDESEGNEGSHVAVDMVTDKHVETKSMDPVPISPFSMFDPRVPSPFDPPAAILRIQLVCNLLESCGPTIVNVTDLPKLQRFFSSFQRYLFTKHSLPPETKFALLDLFDNVESNLKAARKVRDKNNGKKGKSGNYADSTGKIGFVRYTTWFAAHDAVIAYEEAEVLANRQAQDRMLSKAAGAVRNNGGDRTNLLLVNRQDELAEKGESYIGSDESTSEEATNSMSTSSSSSVDSMEREDTDLISQDADSSEDGHESFGESDSVEQEEGEAKILNEDEAESDPAVSEEYYQLQLQQEEFEREIRKLTQEALEKGKMAARAGSGGKVAAGMVHASQFVGKKVPSDGGVLAVKPILSVSDETIVSDLCSGGVTLRLLKRGHKGRLEAKPLVVPEDTNLAQHALKHGDIKAKERDLLKARVLQYEIESSEQSYGNVYMDQAKLQVIRNRPLLMEDIDRNFTGGSKLQTGGRSNTGRGRGRGGRTLRFF